MSQQDLATIAKAMVAPGKGLLAMDESNRTLHLWKGLAANAKIAQEALLYRAKCNSAARQGKYSEKMEHAEPALVGAEGLHSHLSSQD